MDGFAQGLQGGLGAGVQAHRRRVKRLCLCSGTRGGGQHGEDFAQRALYFARQASVQPGLRQPGGGHQRIGLSLGQHQRRQLKACAQAVAHTRFAFNGHALVLQVGHVAVDGAGGHLQPLGQKRGGRQTPPTDELHDLEQAVSAAHGCFSF